LRRTRARGKRARAPEGRRGRKTGGEVRSGKNAIIKAGRREGRRRVWDAARFRKSFFSTSKNVTIFLELGTNVTISSHHHTIFLSSAWNKPDFENLAKSRVLGSRFSNFGLERPWASPESCLNLWNRIVLKKIVVPKNTDASREVVGSLKKKLS